MNTFLFLLSLTATCQCANLIDFSTPLMSETRAIYLVDGIRALPLIKPGIVNEDSNCYANALIQVLFNHPRLNEEIRQLFPVTQKPKIGINMLGLSLSFVFGLLYEARKKNGKNPNSQYSINIQQPFLENVRLILRKESEVNRLVRAQIQNAPGSVGNMDVAEFLEWILEKMPDMQHFFSYFHHGGLQVPFLYVSRGQIRGTFGSYISSIQFNVEIIEHKDHSKYLNDRMLVFNIQDPNENSRPTPSNFIYDEVIKFRGKLYNLHAIVLQPYSGHYTSLVRVNHKENGAGESSWVYFNDKDVKWLDIQNDRVWKIIDRGAKLLFYVEQDQVLGWIASDYS